MKPITPTIGFAEFWALLSWQVECDLSLQEASQSGLREGHVLGPIDRLGRVLSDPTGDADAVAQGAQLLERLGLLQQRGGQLRELLEHRLVDLGLTESQVTAVLALSRDVVERVVWEVVPVLAETMIREARSALQHLLATRNAR